MARNLLLIDGNSILYRAYYALPPLSTASGVPTGAVYGFLTMLLRFIAEKEPSHVVVAFDHPAPTFRHSMYAGYKETRKPTPESLLVQMPVIKDVLEGLNIAQVECPGFEADDIIGTLAQHASREGFTVTILSGDKDCLQLLDENVELVVPVRGITQVKEYSPQVLQEEMGISPGLIVDLKALAGDTSDNIPGIKGIGEKTALSLLKQYGDLDSIYKNLDGVKPPRVKRLLESGQEAAFLCRELAAISREAPMSKGVDDYLWEKPSQEEAEGILSTLEFRSLLSRLEPLLSEGAKEDGGSPHPKAGQVRIIGDEEKLSRFCEEVRSLGRLAIYAPHPQVDKTTTDWPLVLGVSCGGEPAVIRFEEQNGYQDAMWDRFFPLLVDERVSKCGFDLKWLFRIPFNKGYSLKGEFFDVAVASYLLDPTRTSYNLADATGAYSGVEVPSLAKNKTKGPENQDPAPHAAFGAAACLDAVLPMREKLQAEGLLDLASKVEFPLTGVLAAMEACGVAVDLGLAGSIQDEFGTLLMSLEKKIHSLAGEEFNISSPQQLSGILFDKLKMTPVKKTKTGYSTDARVLETLSEQHPLPALVLEYRHYAKLKSTYLDTLNDWVDASTGRVHTTFHQTVTATGRLSSSDPNLQNIPVRGHEGRSLRRIFVAPEGKLLLASDYSQVELRVMAHVSGDTSLIDAFCKNEDIHTRTAAEIFDVPMEEVTPDLRSKAKAVNFGIIYGISDFGLARNTGVTREEARKFIDAYFSRYPKVKEYMDRTVVQARRDKYVTTILGRRRPIPDIDSRNRQRRSFAERAAINTPIQGSAADIIKVAMIRIFNKLREEDLKSRLILQIHDELIFELPADEVPALHALVKREMEGAAQLNVPLKVDIDVGGSWYDV